MTATRSSGTLKEQLSEWLEVDQAAYALALCLGLMTRETRFEREAKHVFWAANPVGEALMQMLDALVTAGVLERDADDRVRWNPLFRGSWEVG